MIVVTEAIALDEDEISERFVKASGPGGQHVNKTSSAVELRFDVRGSPSLPDDVKARLERLAGSRLTLDGVLVLFSQGSRSQEMNRQEVRERLLVLIRQAAVRPKPRGRPNRPSPRSSGGSKARPGGPGSSRCADRRRTTELWRHCIPSRASAELPAAKAFGGCDAGCAFVDLAARRVVHAGGGFLPGVGGQRPARRAARARTAAAASRPRPRRRPNRPRRSRPPCPPRTTPATSPTARRSSTSAAPATPPNRAGRT